MLKEVKLNTRAVTGKCRFAYVVLFNPRAIRAEQTPRYSLCLIIPKQDKETMEKINAAIDDAITLGETMWGEIPRGLKTPLRDGDIERPDKPEYAGCYFINAVSNTKPGVVDKNLDEISDSKVLYSGCFGRASIYFYPYNHSGNKGIGCGLRHVQKLEDGEPLGTISRPQDDFEALDDILG
jgi:hypothetical protein